MASRQRDLATVKLFINYGSDIDIKDLKGKSAWDYARKNENRNIAKWLRDYDANRHSGSQ